MSFGHDHLWWRVYAFGCDGNCSAELFQVFGHECPWLMKLARTRNVSLQPPAMSARGIMNSLVFIATFLSSLSTCHVAALPYGRHSLWPRQNNGTQPNDGSTSLSMQIWVRQACSSHSRRIIQTFNLASNFNRCCACYWTRIICVGSVHSKFGTD
jgi:hypothetical protein